MSLGIGTIVIRRSFFPRQVSQVEQVIDKIEEHGDARDAVDDSG